MSGRSYDIFEQLLDYKIELEPNLKKDIDENIGLISEDELFSMTADVIYDRSLPTDAKS
jgi:hypothetical protein